MIFHEPHEPSSSSSAPDRTAGAAGPARAERWRGPLGYVLAMIVAPLALVALVAVAGGIVAGLCTACGWMLATVAMTICDEGAVRRAAEPEPIRDGPLIVADRERLRRWVDRRRQALPDTDCISTTALASVELGFRVTVDELVDAVKTSRQLRPGPRPGRTDDAPVHPGDVIGGAAGALIDATA